MNDDIKQMLELAASGAPGTKGWADQARRTGRRRSILTGAAMAVIVSLIAVPVAFRFGQTPMTLPAMPAEEGTASGSPTPDVDVMQVSFRQEEVANRHPDVFSGWDLTSDGRYGVLLYKSTRESEARTLAAAAGADGPHAILKAREHSWVDLMEMRATVKGLLETFGLEVVEVVPDPRRTDGLALAVVPDALHADGSLGTPEQWAALQAAGVVGTEPYAKTDEVAQMIHGLPVVTNEGRGWFHLSPIGQPSDAERAQGLLAVREDLFVESAISPIGDAMRIYVKADRLDEAHQILSEAGLNLDHVELVGVPHSSAELQVMLSRLIEYDQSTGSAGTLFLGAAFDVVRGGVRLFVELDAFADLPDSTVSHLRDLGVVSLGPGTPVTDFFGPSLTTISPEPER